MDLWKLKKTGYDPERAVDDGNRFLLANGYMGVRGTLAEAKKDAFFAINLAGVYDRHDGQWREPVNAPNGLFARLTFCGRPFFLCCWRSR